MKNVFHKLSATIMAVVVLMTTMSLTVDMHYCGDMLVDFSLTHQVKSCGMDLTSTTSCENPTLSEKPCCTDKQVIKKGKEDLKMTFDQLSLEQQVFVASLAYTYSNLFEVTKSNKVAFVDYAPPFIRQDVQVLYQNFLI